MDHTSNNILVNVSGGSASIPVALGVSNEEEHTETGEEVPRQQEQDGQMAATPGKEGSFFLPENILTVLMGLIEKFSLTKEQFLAIYEEYERMKFLKSADVKTPTIHQQLQVVQEAATLAPTPTTAGVSVDGASGDMMETGEQDLQGKMAKTLL